MAASADLLLYSPALPAQECHHLDWVGPSFISTHSGKYPTDTVTANLKAIPHSSLFSQVPLGCIELTKINQHNCCFTDGETEAQATQ